MSATTQSYPAHLNTTVKEQTKEGGSLFAWFFGRREVSNSTKPVSFHAPVSPLPLARSTKAAPAPAVLQLPEAVAAELMRALQPRPADSQTKRYYGVMRPRESVELSSSRFENRRCSTSVLETEDRGFPII